MHLIWCVLDRFFDSLIEKTIPFIISKNDKMIIMNLINKSHNKNTKLHLELSKLEKAFNNKSDVYKEIVVCVCKCKIYLHITAIIG